MKGVSELVEDPARRRCGVYSWLERGGLVVVAVAFVGRLSAKVDEWKSDAFDVTTRQVCSNSMLTEGWRCESERLVREEMCPFSSLFKMERYFGLQNWFRLFWFTIDPTFNDAAGLYGKLERFTCFSADGKYKGLLVDVDAVDAHVTNGFSFKDDVALMVLSDVVVDRKNQAVCDDWPELIMVDGSLRNNQREQRIAGKVASQP